MPPFLSHAIGGSPDSMFLVSLAIIASAIILEDLTTVLVGVLAADQAFSIPFAFFSIYLGIFIADMGLYALGAYARAHPRLMRYIDHDFTAPLRSWLEARYPLTVFAGHFIPGLRVTTYLASGFFRRPLTIFIPMAMAGGLFLETVLFTLSYWFGSVTTGWVSHARWGIAAIFVLVLFIVGRRNLLLYRAKKRAAESGRTVDALEE